MFYFLALPFIPIPQVLFYITFYDPYLTLFDVFFSECGGIFNKLTGALSVNFNAATFGVTKSKFVHCTWYFELDSPMIFQLFLSKFSIYHDTHYQCVYYNEFLSIQSWNETNGMQLDEIFKCKKLDYSFPMRVGRPASSRFALIIHFERYYSVAGEIKGIAFLGSTGKQIIQV